MNFKRSVLSFGSEELERGSLPSLDDLMEKYAAFRIHNFLSAAESGLCVEKIYGLSTNWKSDYNGEQFSLPNNYYARASDGTTEEYFAAAGSANRMMADQFSVEQERLQSAIRSLLKEDVTIKAGWCGPGFVVFPCGEYVSVNNGPIHIDAEGLVDGELATHGARACAFVLMLQKPDTAGGVRLWDIPWNPEVGETDSVSLAAANYDKGLDVDYEVGDLVILDSLMPHQILSFGGSTDRVTMNAFGSCKRGKWLFWF